MAIHVRPHSSLPHGLANRPWRKVSAAVAGAVSVGAVLTVLAVSGGISGIAFSAAAAAVALAIAGLGRAVVGDSSTSTHEPDPAEGKENVTSSASFDATGTLSALATAVLELNANPTERSRESPSGDVPVEGKLLTKGESLQSHDGTYTLTLQDDGNLVLAARDKALWATGTEGQDVTRAEVRPDGKFILYKADQAMWLVQIRHRQPVRDGGNTTHFNVVLGDDSSLLHSTYTVKSGDTLWRIAERFYGDGTKYRIIAHASGTEDTIANPDVPLNPGSKLIIPSSSGGK
jgi:nucleoid-associated protein YgaU